MSYHIRRITLGDLQGNRETKHNPVLISHKYFNDVADTGTHCNGYPTLSRHFHVRKGYCIRRILTYKPN